MENKLTNVSELGEFGLIEKIQKETQIKKKSTIKGIGDDAAVLHYEKPYNIVSTDMYVEGVHFDMMYTPLQHLGYKSITASISDIYAMNAKPEQVLVSIAISSKFSLEAIDSLYSGMHIACNLYGIDLVGGDTTSSRSGMVICVTAMGSANENELCYRNTANNGDILCVTGDLGGAYLGLQVLEREKRVYLENPAMQPELHGYDYIIKRQLRPEARKDIIEILADLNIKPTSMIDVSDGLSSESMHLAKQSGLGVKLFEENIPIDENTYHTALELNLDATMCALNGGDDYELLLTLSPADYDKIKLHPDFTAVGHMTSAEGLYTLITKSGNEYPLEAQGWKHFQ